MNANELADKLQELDSKLHLIELFKSATMLRQQQAEIEALQKQIENLRWDVNHREQDIDHLKTRLVDAKWKYDTSTHEYKYSSKFVQELEAKIAELAGANPLYTHPVKELTDEEINKIYLEKYDGHMGFLSPDEVRDFARAILRKAQEK